MTDAPKLVWHQDAQQDLLDIYEYIAPHNPIAAEKLYDRIENLANMLIDFPGMGTQRDEIRPRIRMLVQKPYLILYELTPDIKDTPAKKIEIIGVVHGRRNLAKLF